MEKRLSLASTPKRSAGSKATTLTTQESDEISGAIQVKRASFCSPCAIIVKSAPALPEKYMLTESTCLSSTADQRISIVSPGAKVSAPFG